MKLSGAHRLSVDAPDYPDAKPFHEALVRTNPERLVWGTDWPHRRIESDMLDAGHLLDLFTTWTAGYGDSPLDSGRQSGCALRFRTVALSALGFVLRAEAA